MRIHYLQHVPFENLGQIAVWAMGRQCSLTRIALYDGDPLPTRQDFDWLIVLGGPMNIYAEDRFPWLTAEKRCIADAIAAGKTVLGICLGAQLIADVLGGKVSANPHKEIGWYPVSLTSDAGNSSIFHDLPPRFMALHWHGDTFAIPPRAVHTLFSEACANQAFDYRGRVVGLQFHLESTPAGVEQLVANSGDELVAGPFIQPVEDIRSHPARFSGVNSLMTKILDNLAARGATE